MWPTTRPRTSRVEAPSAGGASASSVLRWTSPIEAMILRRAISARSRSSVASAWAADQSTASPSATDEAISRRAESPLMTHFLGEPHERASDRHARGIRAGFSHLFGDLGVRQLQFDAQHDRLAFVLGQLVHRPLVARDGLAADRLLEWRGGGVDVAVLVQAL